MASSIISTDKAKCRDCYRCVRVCPVKAIRIQEGQARVDSDRCIICGTCVRECPQRAKHVRNDLDNVRQILASPAMSIASVAPSFPAAFPEYAGGLLQSALIKMGFDMVTETAVGAEIVAEETAKLLKRESGTMVTSACPVVVSLIEHYHPSACGNITPIQSPMIAHAKYLKNKYGQDCNVIFVGPCSAKKMEAQLEAPGIVDAVLTFEELRQAFIEDDIQLKSLQPRHYDDVRPANAQLFPLEGGLARTAAISSGLLNEDFAAVSGSEHVEEMIAHLSHHSPIRLFEALFCTGGCINGACVGVGSDIFTRKNRVLQYHKRNPFEAEEIFNPEDGEVLDLSRAIMTEEITQPTFAEEEILSILRASGKDSPEDELNCGACGYASCRANAVAVLMGMAERSMCLPWMRQLAERKTDQIIDNSPNGIVMVDDEFNIVSFNPSFGEMFACSEEITGRPISTIMDPGDFERVAADLVPRISGKTVIFPQYGLVTSASIYRIEDERVMIGLYANITKTREDEDRIARIRMETLANAEQVIDKQMRMAQEIASILGETTSETRVLLRKLTRLAEESEEPKSEA